MKKINKYELSQNYPHPFNPNTTIKFRITEVFVYLNIYNLIGEEIVELASEELLPNS
jgi:hypothetical protein